MKYTEHTLPVGIDWYEFNERAAIMEYDGGLSREDAERLALESLKKGGQMIIVFPE